MSSDSDEGEFESADEGDYPFEDAITTTKGVEPRSDYIEDCSHQQKLDKAVEGKEESELVDNVRHHSEEKELLESEKELIIDEKSKEFEREDRLIDERSPSQKEDRGSPAQKGDEGSPTQKVDEVNSAQKGDEVNSTKKGDEGSPTQKVDEVNSAQKGDEVNSTKKGDEGSSTQKCDEVSRTHKGREGSPRLKDEGSVKEGTKNHEKAGVCAKESEVAESGLVLQEKGDGRTKESKAVSEKSNSDKTQKAASEKEVKTRPRAGGKKLGRKIESSQKDSGKQEHESSKQKSPVRTLRIEKYAKEREEAQEKEQQDESASWGWGWKDLSSTLLSTASVGVTTISEHVTQGVDTVLEVVDSIAPSPEELARRDVQRQKEMEQENSEESSEKSNKSEDKTKKEKRESPETSTSSEAPKESSTSSGFGIFSSVWGSAGSKVLSTGLNTLEFIGKKTMDVIQDGDPGLVKKRSLLKGNTTSLSQTLREAREEAEKQQQQQSASADAQICEIKDSFALHFDECQGLVHLEALELLSRQCDASLHKAMLNLSGGQLADVQDSLASIEELLALAEQSEGDEEDLDIESANKELEQLLGHIEALRLSVCTESIGTAWRHTCDWASADSIESANRAFSSSVRTIARVTASSIEVFHRLAQQLLLQQDDTPSRPRVMRGVTETRRLFCRAVSREASAFSQTLTRLVGDHSLITDVFLEASSGSEYISNACQLLVPVLQLQVVRD